MSPPIVSPPPSPRPATVPAAIGRPPSAALPLGTRGLPSLIEIAEQGVGPWRALCRGMGIASIVGLHFVAWACWRLGPGLFRRPAERRRAIGRWLCRGLEALGATYIKAGQVLSCRADLVSEEVCAELRRLQDRVRPVASGRIFARIERELDGPISEHFAELDAEPVASASIAQVHRGRLDDGRLVAVKVRRPGLARSIAEDVALARAFAGFLERTGLAGSLPMVGLFDEVSDAILQQLDLAAEARNGLRFRAGFEGTERLRFPAPLPELSTPAMLVSEWMEQLTKVDEADAFSEQERHSAAVVGLRALYRMIFDHGFVHADLHPGNVFLRRYGEVVIVDPGLVVDLSPEIQDAFVDFFFGMVNDDGLDCARVVIETASALPADFDRAAFEAEMVTLISRHSRLKADEFEVTRFAAELFELQRRFAVRGTTHFTLVILALVVYEGIVKRLHPDLDFQKEARGFLIIARYGRPRSPSRRSAAVC